MADLKNLAFRWTIENFDMCIQPPNQMIESPLFSIDTLKSTRFSVRIYPRGSKDASGKYISLYLKRHKDDGPENIDLKYEFSFVTSLSQFQNKHESKESFKKESCFGMQKFYARNRLNENESYIIEGDRLTVQCKLLPQPASNCNDSNESEVYDEEICKNLSRNIATLLKTGSQSDMCLDGTFDVHRCILQCRCPKLMSQITSLPSSNTYSLSGVESTDMTWLLNYLYTGILGASSMSNGILAAACTYELPDIYNAFPFPSTVSATTDVDVIRQSFDWVIDDFSKLKEYEELVYNQFYSNEIKNRISIGLTVTKRENGSTTILLKFRRICTQNITYFRCRIKIKQPLEIVKELEHRFDKEDSCETNLIWDTQSAGNLNHLNTLHLSFVMSLSNVKHTSKIWKIDYKVKSEKVGVQSVENLQLLQKDLKSLYNNPELSDFTLTVHDTKFNAHKAILCARSEVFAGMLRCNMKENQENNTDIDDFDESTVSSMLMYIYYGSIKLANVSEAINVYAAADKYDLPILKKKCSVFLKSNSNASNIGEILLHAVSHNDEDLRTFANNFIVSNANEVLLSEKFSTTLKSRLDVYPDLFKAVLAHLSNRR